MTLVRLELGWNRQVGRSRMGSTRRHVRPDVAATHQPRQATSIRTRRLPSVVVAARAERARFSHGYTASPWKFLRFHILVLHKNPSRRERITASMRVIVRVSHRRILLSEWSLFRWRSPWKNAAKEQSLFLPSLWYTEWYENNVNLSFIYIDSEMELVKNTVELDLSKYHLQIIL